jgi:hypothetical protein
MVTSPRAASQTTGVDPPVASPGITQVYVPASVGTPHCVLFNNGASPAYIGGSSVTAATGLFFPPNAQLSLPYAPFGIWATDSYVLGTATTTVSANVLAGGTTLAAGSLASMTVGGLIQLGNAGKPTTFEVVAISAFVNAGTLTTTTPVLYDHISGATVTTVAAQSATSLSVNDGTT